jgi:hypothetical protein
MPHTNENPASLYVLGLIYLTGDTQSTPVLDRQQLTATALMFANTIFHDLVGEPGADETYYKFRLSPNENVVAYNLFVGEDMADLIDEVQFGYYHHRAIFRFRFRGGTSLPALRDARARASRVVRERCFEAVTGKVIPPAGAGLQIEYIYSYSLLVVPKGTEVLASERAAVGKDGYDEIYTVRSTTFGVHLPDQRSIIMAKRHYVRISVPGTVIYVDGNTISSTLLGNIVDAIYYGGLYQKAKEDNAPSVLAHREPHPSANWTNDLLLSVFAILVDSVRTNERGDHSVQIARFSLAIGVVVLAISIINVVFH